MLRCSCPATRFFRSPIFANFHRRLCSSFDGRVRILRIILYAVYTFFHSLRKGEGFRTISVFLRSKEAGFLRIFLVPLFSFSFFFFGRGNGVMLFLRVVVAVASLVDARGQRMRISICCHRESDSPRITYRDYNECCI